MDDERNAITWLRKIIDNNNNNDQYDINHKYKRARGCVAILLKDKIVTDKKGLALAWMLLGSLFDLEASSSDHRHNENKTSIPLDGGVHHDRVDMLVMHNLEEHAASSFDEARRHLG